MTTHVDKRDNKYYIVHDGRVYKDTLISHSVKGAREQARAELHGRAASKESTREGRRWRFYLRNNAAKRAQRWLSCST